MKSAARKQLVGLLAKDGSLLEEGAQVVATPGQEAPMKLIGHVTSSYASAALGHPIALAMVAGGRARIGETLWVPMHDGEVEVTVTKPVFYDPEGARLHG
jgi:sarcosine oxidase subunit alpha